MRLRRGAATVLVLVAWACLGAACDAGIEPADYIAAPSHGANDSAQWEVLVEAEWVVEPYAEAFICALHTVEADLLIHAFRSDAPVGTHHTVVTVTEPAGPDRVFDCDPGTLSDAMVYASASGTDDLALPDGVAIRVPAGKQILLNLHLYNTTTSPIRATSRTLVQVLEEAELAAEAEVVFAGTADFELPPNAEASATGSCVFTEDATVLSLWPHMHERGRHMVVEHVAVQPDAEDPSAADTVTTLLDAPFHVLDQTNHAIEPLVVRAGDRLEVTCHWTNDSDETIGYGDTAGDEMCFAGVYRYPAFSTGLYCLDGS